MLGNPETIFIISEVWPPEPNTNAIITGPETGLIALYCLDPFKDSFLSRIRCRFSVLIILASVSLMDFSVFSKVLLRSKARHGPRALQIHSGYSLSACNTGSLSAEKTLIFFNGCPIAGSFTSTAGAGGACSMKIKKAKPFHFIYQSEIAWESSWKKVAPQSL